MLLGVHVLDDLLDPARKVGVTSKGLEIKEDKARGIFVRGLQSIVVEDAGKLQELMERGNSMRVQAATLMNERSSRSHSIFCIKVQQRDAADESHNVYAKVSSSDDQVLGPALIWLRIDVNTHAFTLH